MRKLSLLLLLSLFSLPPPAEAREIDRTLLLVNGDVVLHSDLTQFRKNFPLRKEIDPFVALVGFSLPSADDKSIYDYMIQEHLILQKYPAQEDQIEEEINSVQRNNHLDRDKLKDVLLAQGVKFEDYRKLMGISVSKHQLIEKDLRPLAAVSDDDVKNYYYTDPVYESRRKQQRLVLSFSLQQMLLPNSAATEIAMKRLRAGEDFDSVAADLGPQGAEITKLGTISEENMNPKIRDAIQGLKVGEFTKPIPAGSGGAMVLRVLQIGAPQDPVFEQDKEKIRNELFQRALLNQLKIWTEKERASAYVHVSEN